MKRRLLPTTLLALPLALAVAAPSPAEPALERTPNLEGTWTAPPGTLFFSFLHRFSVGSPPLYSVSNVPNFHLSTGLRDWLSLGAQYATETFTVPGASQELELFAKQILLEQGEGTPVTLSLKEAINVTALSPDLELGIRREFGALSLLGTLRAMGNYRFSGEPRAVVGVGTAYRLTEFLSLAGDVAMLPYRRQSETALVWGLGSQIQIPFTPHTLSLQATNAGTDTIQGSSVDTGAVRYGFAFTVPFSNAGQWARIFTPSSPAPKRDQGSMGGGEVTAEARAFFASRCAGCHGAQGQGGFGPDLRGVEQQGDDFIANRIKTGSPKGMPAFESALSPEELSSLVAYVKSL